MFNLLIDTCVWLDLAKDYQNQAILFALEELIRQKDVQLVLLFAKGAYVNVRIDRFSVGLRVGP